MKVLHLPYGVAGPVLCRALRRIGVEAVACHFWQSKFRYQPDVCLRLDTVDVSEQKERRRQFLHEAAQEYNLFHFHFGETFLPDGSDLAYLKQLGKKLVVQHHGSDVRMLSVARRFDNPFVRVKGGEQRSETAIISRLRLLSQWIDKAIVSDDELLPYVKPFYRRVTLIRQAVETEGIAPVYPSAKEAEPLIVHAPSHRYIKGTEYVLEAVERLRRKRRFRFRLLEGVSHQEAMEAFRQADIVVDQLRIGAYGMVSLEAMATGKPVVCYIRDDLRERYPAGLPVVSASPDTLYKRLKWLVDKPKKRRRLGIEGRRYVETHHEATAIAGQLADLYRRL